MSDPTGLRAAIQRLMRVERVIGGIDFDAVGDDRFEHDRWTAAEAEGRAAQQVLDAALTAVETIPGMLDEARRLLSAAHQSIMMREISTARRRIVEVDDCVLKALATLRSPRSKEGSMATIAEGTDQAGRPFRYRPITVVELIDALALYGNELAVIFTRMGPERVGFVACLRVVAGDQHGFIPLEIDDLAALGGESRRTDRVTNGGNAVVATHEPQAPSPTQPERRYQTPEQFLEQHRGLIGRTKLYQELRAGRIAHVKIGRRILIPVNALDRLLSA